MIVQYASDLHLEFPENKSFLLNKPLKALGNVLLLSGDIVPFRVMDEHKDFFKYVSDHFESTYWVPGNHEYYYYDIADKYGAFHEKIKDNVHLLNNTALIKEGVNFIFSSLWSNISPNSHRQIEGRLSDFQVIKHKGSLFTVDQYNKLHRESLEFLKTALHEAIQQKTVVVTHHVPTFLNYPDRFKGDILNEAFAVELFELIEFLQPNYWIYGHTHFNTSEFNIKDTTLLTNQLGYVRYDEHKLFKANKVFSF